MNTLCFSDTVKYNNNSVVDYFCNAVEDYFCFREKKAFFLQNRAKDGREKVVFSTVHSSSVVKTIKIASYFTGIIPLVFLIAKICIRLKHNFKVVNVKSKMEKGFDIDKSIPLLKSLLPKIISRSKDSEFTLFPSGYGFIFKLNQAPNIIFKMASPHCSVFRKGKLMNAKERTEHRFANMLKAKEVCLINRLGQLVIPQAKKIEIETDGKKYTLIAEEKLDFNSEESAQQEFYSKHSSDLNETARQLAVFIAKTGFNDVTWRNIPLMNETQSFLGSRRVALIDLESMESVVNGFMGDGNGSCGLLGCVSTEQMELIIKEAQKMGVILYEEDVKRKREFGIQRLESRKQLQQFHKEKNIVTGKEPIQVDLHSLGLDLGASVKIKVREVSEGKMIQQWTTKTVTLQKVVEDIIDNMNSCIQNSSDQASIQGKRHVCFRANDMHKDPLSEYKNVNFSLGNNSASEKTLLYQVLQTLEDKKIFFKVKNTPYGYYVQA